MGYNIKKDLILPSKADKPIKAHGFIRMSALGKEEEM